MAGLSRFTRRASGKFAIAGVSPSLDDLGNRGRAQRAITDISSALGGHPSASKPGTGHN